MVRGNGERSRTKARGASNGLIQTPWGEVQTPMAILPYFYCPICKKDVNIGDCSHNRQDFTAPVWIREFALWKKGKFEVEGEKLEKFRWLRDNAVVFSDGFESGDYSAWMQNGTPVVSSSFAREGTYSSNTNASNEYVWQDLATAMSTMYYRFYVYINSMTLNSGQRLGFAHVRAVTKTSWLYGVYLYNNGTNNAVILRYGSGVNLGLSWKLQTTVTMTTGVWYCLETKIVVDNTNGSYTTWLDGNQITGLDVTGIDNDDLGNADRIHLGGYDATAAAGDVFSDSVIVDDANYIGPINDLGVFINDALINNAMIR
jgi:hypothetical protein